MRILVFYGNELSASRGTPSRARNIARALAAREGTEVLAVSRDSKLEIPGLGHRSLAETTLLDSVVGFRPDVVYGHTHKALPHLAAIDSSARVVDLHGDPVAEKLEETWRPRGRRLRSAARMWWTDRRYLGRVDGCTTVSRLLAKRVERRGLPARVIRGGVDPALFAAATGEPGPGLVIGYAGNFRPYQGLQVLFEAASTLLSSGVELRLILVGDPGDGALGKRALETFGDRVELTGPLPYADVPAALAAANVLVIPRPDSGTARAGLPSKLAEYMALGKALIVTDVGDQAAVIRDNDAGIVVAPDDAASLARALERLRHNGLRERLGSNARATAERSLTWKTIADEIVDFLHEVLDRR